MDNNTKKSFYKTTTWFLPKRRFWRIRCFFGNHREMLYYHPLGRFDVHCSDCLVTIHEDVEYMLP